MKRKNYFSLSLTSVFALALVFAPISGAIAEDVSGITVDEQIKTNIEDRPGVKAYVQMRTQGKIGQDVNSTTTRPANTRPTSTRPEMMQKRNEMMPNRPDNRPDIMPKRGNEDMRKRASTTASTTLNMGGKDNKNARGASASICTKLIASETRILESLTKNFKNNKGENIRERIEKLRENREKVLDKRQDDHDDNRTLRYAKLKVSADTQAEKDAVVKFKTTVEAAVVTRRTAIGGAITTYQSEVNAILAKYPSTQASSTATAISALEADIKAAFEKVKTDCTNASSTDRASTLKNFQASLEALKKKYRESLNIDASASTNLKNELKAATAKRDTAIKSARDAFQATYKTAKTELKVAFGMNVTETATTTATTTSAL